MKKIFAIALVAVMSLVVVACKKGDAQAVDTNAAAPAKVETKVETNVKADAKVEKKDEVKK